MMSNLIRDFMTKNPVTIKTTQSLQDAWSILTQNSFHHLPVVDSNNSPAGILSSTDIEQFRKLFSLMQDNVNPIINNLTVKDVMTVHLHTIHPGETMEDANDCMLKNKIRALPVIESGQIIGIISETDILHYYHQKYS